MSEAYSLLPADLRDVAALQTALEAAGFRADAPTYVLAECVLVYMEPLESAALVRWLGSYLASAVFLTYEQVGSRPPLSPDSNATTRFPHAYWVADLRPWCSFLCVSVPSECHVDALNFRISSADRAG